MTHTPRIIAIAVIALLSAPSWGWTHCDTLDGPVVAEARVGLESGDVTPVLKWVSSRDEVDIRSAFDRTRAVRTLSDEARELADTAFFETLVRIHRAGEGAPYSGLKPAGTVDPAVELADQAIASRSLEELGSALTNHVAAGVHERFDKVVKAAAHSADSVEAGRAFVAAYVEFTHYVEGIHRAAAGASTDHRHP